MNKQDILNGFLMVTKEQYDACRAEAASVEKNRPTERGALQLKAGIYHVAIAAGLISGTDRAAELMIARFQNLAGQFSEIADYYQALPDDRKELMAVSLYSEVFMRANFYDLYQTDLEQAKKDGDPQKIFKAKIKKDVLDGILKMWRDYRVQNGLFVFAFDGKERGERK